MKSFSASAYSEQQVDHVELGHLLHAHALPLDDLATSSRKNSFSDHSVDELTHRASIPPADSWNRIDTAGRNPKDLR